MSRVGASRFQSSTPRATTPMNAITTKHTGWIKMKENQMNPSSEAGDRPSVTSMLKRILLSRPFIIAVAALACYTLTGFFLAPYLVKRYVPIVLEKQLQIQANIAGVRMNPFLLTAEIKDFSLKEQDGRPLAGFRRLFVNFQTSSLFRWAWTFRDVVLDAPVANVVIEKDGSINLAKLFLPPTRLESQKPKDQKTEPRDSQPPRMRLDNIVVHDGRIDVSDMRQSQPAAVSVQPLDIKLANISTLPEGEGTCTLDARTEDGESFRWEGRISLAPLRSEGTLAFAGIRAAKLWEFARDAVNLTEPKGTMDAKMDYSFALDGGNAKAAVRGLEIRMSDISLALAKDPDPFLTMPEVVLEAGRFDLADRKADIGSLSVRGGRLSTAVDAGGRFRLQDILKPAATKARPQPQTAAGDSSWRLNVEKISVDDFGLAFADMSRDPPAKIQTDKVHLSLKASVIAGPADLEVRLENIASRIQNAALGLAGAPRPIVDVPSITVESGAFDLAARSFTVAGITATGGTVAVVREKAGDINLLNLIVPKTMGTVRETRIQASEEGNPWQFMARKIGVSGFHASLTDIDKNPDKPVFDLAGITVDLLNVDGRSPMDFSLAATVSQGGRLSAKGTVTPKGPALDAAVEVADLDLTPFQPYIEPFVELEIVSGRVSTKGTLLVGKAEAPSQIVYEGKVHADDLRVLESMSRETLVGWTSLQTSQVHLDLMPNRLDIDEINLSHPVGKLFIAEDGTVNVVKLIKKQETGDTSSAVTPETKAGDNAGFPVRISKVRMADGIFDFTDLSLIPPFATKIRQLAGVIIGLSSEKNARAQVQLAGQVDEYGSAKIEGEINAFDPKGFTDIGMIFRNVEMTRLSPYSGKFAGRRITSGKLSMDLKYKINDSELMGDNKIVVDRLVLGEKVDSPDAPNLPLDLAVALLQDGNGVIDIGLPVRGNLNDPKFSYGHLVWKAIVNLLTKIVTSPFRALGALIGTEGEAMDAVFFEAGSTKLAPPEKEKLAKLLEALKLRPQLSLAVTGRYNSKEDGLALEDLQVRRTLAEKRGETLKAGEDPGPVDFSNPKVQKTLEAWFVERFGAEALDKLSAQSAAAGKTEPPDPGKRSKEMFRRLLEKEPLAPGAVKAVGQARAAAVIKALTGPDGISVERVAAKPPQDSSGKNSMSAGLSLNVKPSGKVPKQ